MGNSATKHEEQQEKELQKFREKFAGAKRVVCAASIDGGESNFQIYDFTEVKPEDINYGLHGKEYIKAAANHPELGRKAVCYLLFIDKEAIILDSTNASIFTPLYAKPPELELKDYMEASEGKPWETEKKESPDEFETFVQQYCIRLAKMLIKKNKSYGNSALDPVRIFSSADSEEQIKVRLDDKLSRIKRGNNDFNEDTIQDIQGYLVLWQFLKAQKK